MSGNIIMFLNVSERKNIDGERCPSRDEGGTFVFLLTCVKKRGNLILLATCFIVRQVKRNKSISGGISSYMVPCPWLGESYSVS